MSNIKKINNLESIRKVLVIQFRPFGDVFISSVIFETLKKKMPEAELHYLVFHPYQVTVLEHPFIDHVIPFKIEKGLKYYISRLILWKKIAGYKFDLVIDLQNNPGSQLITFFSGAKYRLGYQHGQFSFMYNYRSQEGGARYSASLRFDILKPLNIKEEKWRFYYFVTNDSIQYINQWLQNIGLYHHEFVVMSPGSPMDWKKWSLEYYAQLADMIVDQLQLPIILLWAKNEKEDCLRIANLMKNKSYLAIDTSLNQAAALLQKTKLLICNDGGINHISCATETTTIAIMKVYMVKNWSPAPFFSHHHHVVNEKYVFTKGDHTFGVSPKMVFQKICEVLANGKA